MSYTSLRHSRHVCGLTSLFALALLYSLTAPQQAVAQARRTYTPQPIIRNSNNNGRGGATNGFGGTGQGSSHFLGGTGSGSSRFLGGTGGTTNNGPKPTIQNTGVGNTNVGRNTTVNSGQRSTIQNAGRAAQPQYPTRSVNGSGNTNGFGGTGRGSSNFLGGTGGGNANYGGGRSTTPNQGGNMRPLHR
jgi:hypothetical protein